MGGLLFGKTAVVTGAGRGLGKSIAEALASEGARLVLGARTISHGDATLSEFLARGQQAVLQPCDVTVKADCEAIIARAHETFGGLDILVHCAADIPHGRVAELKDEEFERSMRSVLYAGFYLARAALPLLGASHEGRIVFISSVAGSYTALPGMAHYGAAKAGLDAFTRGLAVEVGQQGITVNTINPGLIATDRMRARLDTAQQKSMAATIPIARVGRMQEVAELAVFLASEKAGYITGESIVIDGGSRLSRGDLPRSATGAEVGRSQ
jgi:3-oxoacyl-[acyl-carrier protein] reductase